MCDTIAQRWDGTNTSHCQNSSQVSSVSVDKQGLSLAQNTTLSEEQVLASESVLVHSVVLRNTAKFQNRFKVHCWITLCVARGPRGLHHAAI